MTITKALPDPQTASVALESNYPGVNKATVWRYINGEPTEVRGYTIKETGQEVPPSRDYEAPLGVQVGYASLNWTTTKPAPPALPDLYTTVVVKDTTGWIKFPAHPEQNFALECITSLPTRKWTGNAETFRVIGRSKPIAIHDVMTWWEGSVSWIAPDLYALNRTSAVVGAGSICMLQTMPAYGGINEYISIGALNSAHAGLARAEMPEYLMSIDFKTIDAPVGVYTVDVTYTYDAAKTEWVSYGSTPNPAVTSVLRNYTNYYTFYLDDEV